VIELGGIPFAIGPPDRLSADDRARLAALGRPAASGEPFAITLVGQPLEEAPAPAPGPVGLRWQGGRLRLDHHLFQAEVDPAGRRASLFRREPGTYPLDVVLRTSLLSRLPMDGGLPLHAAGVVTPGGAIAFFGPSGAGKSTLAATSRDPILSDELVAVVRRETYRLARSGFWGELGERARVEEGPLVALVEIAKGAAYALDRLAAPEAVRRLAHATAVPFAPPLWEAALDNMRAITRVVPAFRMTWSPQEPPWERLAGDLQSLSR
jgi:hypothetical protein